MAELTVTTFVSLDGVMQGPGRPDEDTAGGFAHGGWVFPLIDEGFGGFMVGVFAKADAFLLGRITYDIFAAYWPKVTAPADPIASKLNGLPKFVATRTRNSLDWSGSTIVRDPAKEVAGLKQRFDGELQVHGSGDLIQTLLAHDLIDEFRVLTFPVLIGSGKRLFASGTRPASLHCVSSMSTPKGISIAVYRRAGDLVTGSFT